MSEFAHGLSDAAERLLASWPEEYRNIAIKAVSMGKAFCPSCHFAGMSNCGYFDECGAFIEPSGHTAQEGADNG